MSSPNPSGSSAGPDILLTLPEPPRPPDGSETPAPGELTSPQLPGLSSRGSHRAAPPRTPGLPEVPGYELTEEIARGGMGIVYAAYDVALGREVAIKTLLPALAGQREMTAQFEREARITAQLPHPGVPPVHALGTLADGRPFLVMKLIRGRTLAALLAARARRQTTESISDLELTTPDAPGLLLVFEQICQAVAFAHSQGIIHRDLKPQNIMVGLFGEVQVMDWGLAKEMHATGRRLRNEAMDPVAVCAVPQVVGGASPCAATQLGTVKGTPSYMPPEQARGEWDAVDPRADVFALGGLLCTLLTGAPPYNGTTIHEVCTKAMKGDLGEAFRQLLTCSGAPELVRLAMWCLSPDPAQRPPDARAVAGLVELFRLCQEDQARALESERIAAIQAEAAEWQAAAHANESELVELRKVPSREQLNRWFLAAVVAGVMIGLGAACCWSRIVGGH